MLFGYTLSITSKDYMVYCFECLSFFHVVFRYYRLYHSDPVLNPLTPWDRPPIKTVFCIYGTDLKTEVFVIVSD